MNRDKHRELGEVEGSLTEVVPLPEVAGGRKWVRVGSKINGSGSGFFRNFFFVNLFFLIFIIKK